MTVNLDEALRLVHTVGAAVSLPAETVGLGAADGRVLAANVIAATHLPVTDTSAMDGWAVAGDGPWCIKGFVHMGAPPGVLSAGKLASSPPVVPSRRARARCSARNAVGNVTASSPRTPRRHWRHGPTSAVPVKR